MKAMILAAGKGVRMRPLTETMPKPMLPIAGRPALVHTLRWLRRHGVFEAVINLHHAAARISDALGDGTALGMAITYSHEPGLLGTAGALKKVERQFADRFVVVYGDVLTDLDLGALLAFHESRQPAAAVTLTVHEVEAPWECGIVGLDTGSRIVRFEEKPARADVFSNLVNAGVLVMEPAVLDRIPPDRFTDISADLLPALLAAGQPVYGWRMSSAAYLIDFGTPEKYARAQQEWPSRMDAH